ncbi:MAG TPA: transketolase [Planctomycetota bacterium]|nr:transketolase [Planctomycetota bacterium]
MNAPAAIDPVIDAREVAARARRLRLHVLRMAERVGQGYVGQGLGIADLMAALWFGAMRYDPRRPRWADRDRFVLSIGHYSIGLYAALAEAGVIPLDELTTYGADGARLEMSGGEEVPGFEMTGGSLGHGLGQAVGMALGNRLAGRDARTFCLISDGELQEGSIWEAAMAAAHHRLDRLTLFVDMNRQQADGPPERVMNVEPTPDKFAAFGWQAQRVDGNDVTALVRALELARRERGRPQVIVLDTLMGKGVPLFEAREKNHFIRVAPEEWAMAIAHLEGQAS